MNAAGEVVASLARKFQVLFPHVDERQRRLVMGAEARALGHGGIRLVARAAGVREGTVSAGVTELESGADPLGRVRRPGGGRKILTELDPGLVPALLELVEPDVRGDPVSPLRWTTRSTRDLAAELTGASHPISAPKVGALLREQGFSLQGNAKVLEGAQHPRPGRAVPGRAVPVHQRSGRRAPRRWAAGGQRGREEEGDHRGVQERRPGMAPGW
jgi:hypothetical protein